MAKKSCVLVIDDDPNIRKVLFDNLKRLYDVQACESVESALSVMAGGFSPQVAIVDYMLPGLNGDAFVKEAAGVTCIMITGRELDGPFVSSMMKKGALYVVRKPLSMVEIRAMVKKALEEGGQ